LPPSVSRMSKQYGILNISQPYRPPRHVTGILFLYFPIYLQSVYIHSNTISKLCAEKGGRVEECSVAPLREKRVKTLCGCGDSFTFLHFIKYYYDDKIKDNEKAGHAARRNTHTILV
jgi:hypothetical protein